MRTSSIVKWSVAAAALLGLGVVASSTASAAENDENAGKGLEDTGTRHGIRYEGCGHFEVVDPDAIEAWGRANALHFAKWVPKLDELRANPEPAIIEAMQLLFPECPWPPPSTTTFGAERLPWADAMVAATEAAQNMDLAGTNGTGTPDDPVAMAGSMLGRVLTFGLRALPMRRRRRG